MDAEVVDFSISERIYGVLHWFKEALQPLAETRYGESPNVRVALGYLHETRTGEPDVFADIVIPAFRSTLTPTPPPWVLKSDLLPKGYKEQLVALEPPAIHFQFSVLDDEIHVMASCAEFLPQQAKMAFWDLLQKAQARYPEIGPYLQRYKAERKERMKEEHKRKFVDGDHAAVAVPEDRLVTRAGDKKAGMQPQTPDGTVPSATRTVAADIPSWVPKSPEVKQRWRKAYAIMRKMRDERLDPDDWSDNPEPTLDEYRDRLKDRMQRSISTKTIGRILQAGDKKWLK